MPKIEAASFFDIAHDAVNADAPIETTGNNIHVADSSTDRSTNHACMQNFLQALKRSYGSAFAAATALTFQAEIAASKPLTVRMVQEVQDLSRIYVVQQNANCRALFSAGVRPEASLDSIMDEALGTQAHGLDTEVREVLRTAVEAAITERFGKLDESLLTMDTLKQYVSRNPILSAAQELLSGGTALAYLPGSMMDKMFIVGALASSPCAMAFALHKLESIRNAYQQGELSVQNIWEGCFTEHMPPLTESFTDAFSKKVIEILEAKVPDKSGALEMLLFSIPLEKAIEILQSPPSHLDEKVLLAPSYSLALGSSVNYSEEEVMARDIHRRGESAQTIQGAVATSPHGTIEGLRPAAQDIRAGILQARHAGVSREEITQNMRMAFNANTISKAELTLLQASLMETEGPALSDKAQSLLQSNLAELL